MLKIKNTKKLKHILSSTVFLPFCLVFQVLNYIFSIIAIIFIDEKNKFHTSTLRPILICNLVVPAGLTLLLMIIFTLIMIFMYLTGSYDKLKIQIIDVDENGNYCNNENNENNIYSPFNIYIIILMGVVYFWMILSPIYVGLFIWCLNVLPPSQKGFPLISLLTILAFITSLMSALLLIVNVFFIIGILSGCMKIDNRRTIPDHYPTIPIATFSYDPNNNTYGHQIRYVFY